MYGGDAARVINKQVVPSRSSSANKRMSSDLFAKETERERRLRLRKEEMASRSAQPPPSFTAAVEAAAPRTARGAGNLEPAASSVDQHSGESRPPLAFHFLAKDIPLGAAGLRAVIPRAARRGIAAPSVGVRHRRPTAATHRRSRR